MSTVRATLPIGGLSCRGGGALTVERALAQVPGVLVSSVNPATEMAYVQYDPAVCSPHDLLAAVEEVGFRALGLAER